MLNRIKRLITNLFQIGRFRMYSKTDHVPIIYEIARGKAKSGHLDNYLELGIALGACFNKVAPLAKKAFAVDTNPDSIKCIKADNCESFLCDTDSFFKGLGANNPIHFDLIFIDANHQKEFVEKDFYNSYDRLAPDGLIIMHDSYPPNESYTKPELCGNGWKVFDIHIEEHFEAVRLPFYFGLTIIRKPDTSHFEGWK